MSDLGDRAAYKAQCEREAAAMAAPLRVAEDQRTHAGEVMAAHGSVPSVAEQDKRNGAGLPAADNGPDPRGGAR